MRRARASPKIGHVMREGLFPVKARSVLLGFAVSVALVLLFAMPAMGWWLSRGVAPHQSDVPTPLNPVWVLVRAVAAASLTLGAGTLLCVPRFRGESPGLGLGLIAGWVVMSLISGGFLTGVDGRLYETQSFESSWANTTAKTPPDVLADRMNKELVALLSDAPGVVVDVALTGPDPKSSEFDSGPVNLAASATVITAAGKGKEAERTLTERLSTRYTRLDDDLSTRFKVRPEISLEIKEDARGNAVNIALSTPLVSRGAPETPVRRGEDLRRVAASVARALNHPDPEEIPAKFQTVPCPGSAAQAMVYFARPDGSLRGMMHPVGTRPFSTAEGWTGTAHHLEVRGGETHAHVAARVREHDFHFSEAADRPVSMFRRCP